MKASFLSICFLFFFYCTAMAKFDYHSAKKYIENDYIPDLALMLGSGRKLEFEPIDLIDGKAEVVPNGLLVNSCKILLGIEEAMLIASNPSSLNSITGLNYSIGNKPLFYRVEYYEYVAEVILEIKWSLEFYGIPNSEWQDKLAALEEAAWRRYSDGSNLQDLVIAMAGEVGRFVRSFGITKTRFGSRRLASMPPCGGGLFGFSVVVTPANDQIEMIPAIYFEDCKSRGKAVNCHKMNKIISNGDHVSLSGQYYYKSKNRRRYRSINFNKKNQSVFKILRIVKERTLDLQLNEIFGGLPNVCFRNGRNLRNKNCL